MTYFVYELIEDSETRPDNIRYVGVSINAVNRFKKHLWLARIGHRSHCANWIRKLFEQGLLPRLRIAAETRTLQEAFTFERALIAGCREMGYDLTNMTDGGEGGSPSEEVRARLSVKGRGRVTSSETKSRISVGLRKAYEREPEIIERFRRNTLGRKHSQETKDKIGASHRGRKMSADFCAKMRASWVVRKAQKIPCARTAPVTSSGTTDQQS